MSFSISEATKLTVTCPSSATVTATASLTGASLTGLTVIETVETDDHSVGSGPSESEMKEVKSFIQLARKFFKQKKREKAVDLLKQAHKIDPKNAEVLVLLGTVKVEMDDFLDADKYFSKALQGISC